MGRYRAALFLGAAIVSAPVAPSGIPSASAQACTEAQIVAAQEKGSGALRRLNASSAPQLDAKMRELQKARAWSDHDLDDRAYEQLEDDTIRTFDREMTALITRMETLSEPSSALPACERLLELQQTLERMRDIAQQKSRYLLGKLDKELAVSPSAPSAPSGAGAGAAGGGATPAGPAKPPVAVAAVPPVQVPMQPKPAEPKVLDLKPATKAPPEPKPQSEPASPWTTTSRVEPPLEREPSRAVPPRDPLQPAPLESQTYSRSEIFSAGEGVFGNISAGLTGMLDFVFQKAGQPSGYIVGDEGGAAILAGVRYGKGMLHLKGRSPQEVYWRGPSFGYDIGAAGSRMMVLVYNVKDPEDLFTNFGGVDGSAYLVGGLGVTFLTNGRKLMAPIRSGIGVRLGANIGYLKFSHKASWNPF